MYKKNFRADFDSVCRYPKLSERDYREQLTEMLEKLFLLLFLFTVNKLILTFVRNGAARIAELKVTVDRT